MSPVMELLNQQIEAYLSKLTIPQDPILREMEAKGAQRNFPIIGPLVGNFLSLLVQLTRSRRILELGSGFGYSAYWMARAMGEEGEIYLTDLGSDNLDEAREFFRRGKIQARAHFLCGDSLEIMEEQDRPFDLILNDVEKVDYPAVLKKVKRYLRKGGLFITDNVLWHGRIIESAPDDATRAILQFNRELSEDEEFSTSLIPLRDGVSVSLFR